MLKYSQIDQQKTFEIIDNILPLESCLYHQVIPISLEEGFFTIGMIKPDDELILDYLKSILPNKTTILKVEKITPQTHNLIISSYQKYTNSYQKAATINAKLKNNKQKENQEEEKEATINSQTTYIIKEEEKEEIKTQNKKKTKPQNIPPKTKEKLRTPLEINAPHQEENLAELTDLTADELWQELLVRLLKEGIGRLFLERKKDFGRLIITNNGIVNTTLEKVDLTMFEAIFQKVKILANMGNEIVDKTRRIEIERTYEQKRLLFRFQLSPGTFGEEGNIQILRDKALTFYQEKQMDALGEQVLRLTKQLDRKLQQIQDLKKINPTELYVLPQLRVIQAHILERLEIIDQ